MELKAPFVLSTNEKLPKQFDWEKFHVISHVESKSSCKAAQNPLSRSNAIEI